VSQELQLLIIHLLILALKATRRIDFCELEQGPLTNGFHSIYAKGYSSSDINDALMVAAGMNF
jgi:hypothetical protein